MSRIIPASTLADLEPDPATRALIFDWDGTLANTTSANFHSLQTGLGEHGHIISREWFDRRTGLSTEAMLTTLAEEHGLVLDIQAIADRRNAAFVDQFMGIIEPIAPVLAIARSAAARGVKLAIATGSTVVTFAPSLRQMGLDELFPIYVTREDVEYGKPAPDLFLLALDRLDIAAKNALVYEDSDEGLAAAQAAAIDAVDVRPLVAPERIG